MSRRTITIPFVYGSESTLLSQPLENGHTHTWSVYVKGIGTIDPPFTVTFKLHETFPQPNRTFEQGPFIVQESGWGEFDIGIRIQIADKQVTLSHHLQLYPIGANGDQLTTQPGQTLTSEHYDEIVIQDPPPNVANYQPGPSAKYTPQLEQQVLSQLQQANHLVTTTIHSLNQSLAKLTNEHRELSRRLAME